MQQVGRAYPGGGRQPGSRHHDGAITGVDKGLDSFGVPTPCGRGAASSVIFKRFDFLPFPLACFSDPKKLFFSVFTPEDFSAVVWYT